MGKERGELEDPTLVRERCPIASLTVFLGRDRAHHGVASDPSAPRLSTRTAQVTCFELPASSRGQFLFLLETHLDYSTFIMRRLVIILPELFVATYGVVWEDCVFENNTTNNPARSTALS